MAVLVLRVSAAKLSASEEILATDKYKICGFHGGDYEERRLLGYKNPVRTSQETQYVSTTELSQLMICKI
jgi:hypothetical protein